MLAGVSYDYTLTGWYARFDPKKHPRKHGELPIEAWSASGEALVVDDVIGRLVSAANIPGFKGLTQCRRVADVVPAVEGWQVTFPPDDEAGRPEPWTLPVVAWLVDGAGDAQPILPVDGDGQLRVRGWPKGGVLSRPGNNTSGA
jgi:hypothetical protein